VSPHPTPRRPDVTGVEVVGGPERLVVGLAEHDDRWARAYREHRRRILAALAPAPVSVEHIGSTAVPGLAAKPIVDIAVAVEDVTAEEDYLEPLLAAGYVLRVREPGHRLVRTPSRDTHVHVYGRGDPALAEYLLLRDHLRTDAADRSLYESTKRDLLRRSWDDVNACSDAKTEVIDAVKARARAARAQHQPAAPRTGARDRASGTQSRTASASISTSISSRGRPVTTVVRAGRTPEEQRGTRNSP